ncbi:hypothetical protein ACLOJK_018168 [Asimina triloba]
MTTWLLSFSSAGFSAALPATIRCAGSKHVHRLISTAHASDPAAADALIRKFLSSSSKSLSLHAISHLISNHHLSLALPVSNFKSHHLISNAPWYNFNPKIAADMVALLEKHGLDSESKSVISESVVNLGPKDLALFYVNLVESYSKQGLKQQVFESWQNFKQVPHNSSSLRRQSYVSMVSGLCALELPHDAEEVLDEMSSMGLGPSAFEFRVVVLGYGRCGLFSDMRRVLCKMEDFGFALDTVCANMILSCYGLHKELFEMGSWLRRMKELEISRSVRTYNSVLNSCSTIILMIEEPKYLPLSIEGVLAKLTVDEVSVVRELVSSGLLVEILDWSSTDWKLDLHGLHLASAYLIILQWLEELRARLCVGAIIPLEISVVCGSGKHSNVSRKSPVKGLVSEMMFRMNSPLKIDRKNVGKFVAKGKTVKEWLC